MTGQESSDVVVQARGEVSGTERAYANDKVEHVVTRAPGPVLFARVGLTAHSDPAREHPAFAKAELDLNGGTVRAHAAAATMFEAIDRLVDRLWERVERLAHHEEAKHLRLRGEGGKGWKHGDEAAPHPSYFPRPVEERELVRRKTFAVGAMTPDEAVVDLELLDHDFYLFKNRETGDDNVVARSGGSEYELFEPSTTSSLTDTAATIRASTVRPPRIALEDAVGLLDAGDLPFVFFVDPDTRRGQVLYRRYDGHYGLVSPSQ